MPNASPMPATREPMLPRPSTPRRLRSSEKPGPSFSCHLPSRMLCSPLARPRAAEMMSPQASSTVDVPPPAERVWLTGMPRSLQACVSRLGERAPVRLTNLRLGSFAISERGSAMRSRIRHSASNGASFFAASFSEAKGLSKKVTFAPLREPQSA